jgi:YidC/Oxa1 family membrane protein insertase
MLHSTPKKLNTKRKQPVVTLKTQQTRKLVTKTKKVNIAKPHSFASVTTPATISPQNITVPSNHTSTQQLNFSTSFKGKNSLFSDHDDAVLDPEFITMARHFAANPKAALSMFTQTKLAPHHHLSHQGPLRRIRGLLAQQTLLAASAIGLTNATSTDTAATVSAEETPTALTPSDLPTTLSAPFSPIKKHTHLATGVENNAAAGIHTLNAPTDGIVLEPIISDFIPPTPSRTIPIIHDGLEWDEPNFLFRPFIHVIDLIHDTTGLPWWATLISWAWILRTSISPLTYKQQASMVRFTLLQPDVMRINGELRQLDPKTNSYKAKQQELADLYKKNGVGPFTSLFWSMASIPFFILSFMAIRNMANSPYFAGEFATGGFMPYLNLSASGGWELALVNALVNLVTIHTSQPIPVHKMQKLQKIMFAASHVLVLGFIPILSNVNTASLMYFIANNSFSIFFQKLFYSNFFRKIAKLPTNDEVSAVRDIVTEMSSKASQQRQNEPAKKNAYVLENDQKVEVGKTDVLDQARSLVTKRQEDKKTFAVGGASAIESQRLKAERDAVAQQNAAEFQQRNKEIETIQNFRSGNIPGKNIHRVEDNGPKPEKSKAKTVARKGWKKH